MVVEGRFPEVEHFESPTLAAIWGYRMRTPGTPEFLVVQRATADKEADYPNMWGLILEHGESSGGKMEPLIETAIRGIKTEVQPGLDDSQLSIVKITEPMLFANGTEQLLVQMFLARLQEIALQDELQAAKWLTIEELSADIEAASDTYIPNISVAVRFLQESFFLTQAMA